jgi:hypothetical protein
MMIRGCLQLLDGYPYWLWQFGSGDDLGVRDVSGIWLSKYGKECSAIDIRLDDLDMLGSAGRDFSITFASETSGDHSFEIQNLAESYLVTL